MRKKQRLPRSQPRSDLFCINSWHLRVREREKNNVRAARSFGCVKHFETALSGAPAGFASTIETDDDRNAATLEIERVSAALRAEADHRARLSL
jgi:hypothetical protein